VKKMFFNKKKKGMPVPVEEVQRLMKSGLSDKDIIKELKNQGYAYEEIERAMLRAVKAGVGEEENPKKKEDMEAMIERYGEEQPSMAGEGELPLLGELYPTEKQEPLAQEISLPESEEPQLIIEELVEGVVEEKWQRLSSSINKINDKVEDIKVGFEQVKNKIEGEKAPSKDFGPEVRELSNRLEELEIRIGGLEKAFKKLLPSLTKNIESLSGMVHEMKNKE
jgi:hypothetical protein